MLKRVMCYSLTYINAAFVRDLTNTKHDDVNVLFSYNANLTISLTSTNYF